MSERKTRVNELVERMARFNENNAARIKALERGQRVPGVFYPDSHNPSEEEVREQAEAFTAEVMDIHDAYSEIVLLPPDPLQEPRHADEQGG